MDNTREIGEHIANHLMGNENDDITDPVLIAWLAEDKSNKKLLSQYMKIWRESHYYMEADMFDTDLAWKKINEINRQKKRMNSRLKNICYVVSGVAASLLLIIGLSVSGVFERKSDVLVSMSTNYGNRSEVVLPDGSVVKLNSGSNVTYSYNFRKKTREVHFQGEAFFDVAKSDIPFVVKMSDGLEISVLGTSFNLRAYTDDRAVQASLVQGSIALSHEDSKLLMKAGDMAEFDKKTNILKTVEGTMSHTYGWLEKKLYMDNMSLSDVCKHLERWYDVNIVIQQELGESIHFNGVIQEETIKDVMNALSYLSGIQYHVKGKNISVTSK